MVRRRFAIDEEANNRKVGDGSGAASFDDRNKRDAIKGYKKLAVLGIVLFAVLFLRSNVVGFVTVVGDSMSAAYSQGDFLVVKKFHIAEIERFDVVTAEVERLDVVKRVIGLPGETVWIADGKVFIDGSELHGRHGIYTERAGVASEPYVLGEDEYFLMGDNRSGSYDSRDFGAVKLGEISGVVVYRLAVAE